MYIANGNHLREGLMDIGELEPPSRPSIRKRDNLEHDNPNLSSDDAMHSDNDSTETRQEAESLNLHAFNSAHEIIYQGRTFLTKYQSILLIGCDVRCEYRHYCISVTTVHQLTTIPGLAL